MRGHTFRTRLISADTAASREFGGNSIALVFADRGLPAAFQDHLRARFEPFQHQPQQENLTLSFGNTSVARAILTNDDWARPG